MQKFATVASAFLSKFTTKTVYGRVLSQFVEVFESQRDYEESISLLRLLLASPVLQSYHGRWWERLALDLYVKW